MANKDQKRGNRETRKPKQAKAKPAAPASSFIATGPGKSPSKPGHKT
jgi:hypothetical protein